MITLYKKLQILLLPLHCYCTFVVHRALALIKSFFYFLYQVQCQSKVKHLFFLLFFSLFLDSSLPATQLFGYNRSGSAGVSGRWAPLSAQKTTWSSSTTRLAGPWPHWCLMFII